jgi:hypothetical protein
MIASAWGKTQTDWLALLADVQEIQVVLEAFNDFDETGFDNFVMTEGPPIPEPSTFILLLAGILGVSGYGYFCKRHKTTA